MLYVGIDPGESWCGFAALEQHATTGIIRVEARTYSVTARHGYLQMARDILNLLPHAKRTRLIVEDYRIRGSGHQRFSAGNTLRLIGALEYGVSMVPTFDFALIPPSDHGEQETRELFGRVLRQYRHRWPHARNPTWNHCLSAWRVLGHHLFQHDRKLLMTIREQKRSHRCERWLPVVLKAPQRELVAPAGRWL